MDEAASSHHKSVGWANTLELQWPEVQEHASAISRLRQGDLHAITVRGVYHPSHMEDLTAVLESAGDSILKTYFPKAFNGWFYGQNLNLLTESMDTYFNQAALFASSLEKVFPAGLAPELHLANVLEALDGGHQYSAAPGPEMEQSYMFATIRGHGESGYIPPHFDNEVHTRPSYQHLATLVSPRIYSMVLAIGQPDSGGALELFNCNTEDHQAQFLNIDTEGSSSDTSEFESIVLPTRPGDLLIVDSGRYLHRVIPVQGTKTRWSLCSFMAKSFDREAVYCWG